MSIVTRFLERRRKARGAAAADRRDTTRSCPGYRPEPLEARTLFSIAAGFGEATYVSALTRPTAMDFAPDGRLFVCEQSGSIRVIKDGQLLSTPFATVPADSTGERGLLGIAFDPAFASNGYVYVYWTATDPAVHNRISRFTADPTHPDIAAAGGTTLLDLPNLSAATNHNGGALHFGPDGDLYVGVGDNADGTNSQSLATPLGKLLRINPDGTIPTDNPFFSSATGLGKATWALGLRNPFTFAFQPANDRVLINDVGLNTYEEVDEGAAGANYGWPNSEGPTNLAGITAPLYAYSSGGAIAGGTFYNPPDGAPSAFSEFYTGDYFFSDYNNGTLQRIDLDNANEVTTFADNLVHPVDLKTGADGGLYALVRGGGDDSGQVLRFAPNGSGGNDAAGDLQPVISGTLPASAVSGAKGGKVVVNISNAGNTSLAGPVTVTLYASTDADLDVADALITQFTRKLKLRPGAIKALKVPFQYPALGDGDYFILAKLAGGPGITEDATNNVAASGAPVRIAAPFVDLSGSLSPVTAGNRVAGKPAATALSLLNTGNVPASGKLQVSLSLIPDGQSAGAPTPVATPIKKVTLKPSFPKTLRLKFVLPPALPPGTYRLVATLNADAAFTESDTTNNTATSDPFTVG